MNVKTTLFLIPLFFLFTLKGYSQEVNANTVKPTLKKNAVYGTLFGILSGWGYPALFYNVNAERTLWNTNGAVSSVRARIGAGSNMVIGSVNALTGSRGAHFEMNLGATYFYFDHKSYVMPSGALGFRLQRPDDYFLLRVGVGFPEIFYLSFGVAF